MKNNPLLISLVILIFVMSACTPPTSDPAVSEESIEQVVVEEPMDETNLPAATTEITGAYDWEKPVVAILIVDDFGLGWGKSLDTPFNLDETCITTPYGQAHTSIQGLGYTSVQGLGYTSVQGLERGNTPLDKPHGYLVYADLRNEIDTRLGFPQSTMLEVQSEDIYEIERFETTEEDIFLVKVDTLGYTTSIIGPRIQNAVYTLESQPYNIDRFVINMSFGLIPCNPGYGYSSTKELYDEYNILIKEDPNMQSVLEALNKLTDDDLDAENQWATNFPTLNLYPAFINSWVTRGYSGAIIELGNNDYSSSWPTYQIDLFGTGTPDPLYIALSELSGHNVIPIAAAGNFGSYKFPFAPAIWSNVISVSALPSQVDEYFVSNYGEVAMDPDCGDCMGIFEDGTPFTTPYGTSFSAPKLSYLAAMYLLRGGSTACQYADGVTSPPLAYSPFLSWWANLNIIDAAANYCPEFPTQ